MTMSHFAARPDLDLSPVLLRFGSWAVTTYGLECLTDYYPIEKSRLSESGKFGWEQHMQYKPWIVYTDFLEALQAARDYHFCSRVPKKERANPVDLRQRARILMRDGSFCQMCGATPQDGVKLQVDHRVPRAKGGTNADDNLWVLCDRCNLGKSDL